MTSSKYSRSDRLEAAAALVSHGNSLVVADQTGIPASTLRHWHRNDEEFQGMMQELWREYGEEVKATLAMIVKESGEQVLDRLINGDVHRDPSTGESYRLPMRGKEISGAGAIAFDKLALAESRPTSIVRHEDSQTHLQRLADEFAAISRESQG